VIACFRFFWFWFCSWAALLLEGSMYMLLMRRRSCVISRGYDGTLYDKAGLFFFPFFVSPTCGLSVPLTYMNLTAATSAAE
jgi:hypothetical protein